MPNLGAAKDSATRGRDDDDPQGKTHLALGCKQCQNPGGVVFFGTIGRPSQLTGRLHSSPLAGAGAKSGHFSFTLCGRDFEAVPPGGRGCGKPFTLERAKKSRIPRREAGAVGVFTLTKNRPPRVPARANSAMARPSHRKRSRQAGRAKIYGPLPM